MATIGRNDAANDLAIPTSLRRATGMAVKPTVQDLAAEIEALKAQLAEARKAQGREIRLKCSEKGCLQVLGIGSKFGFSFYPSQILKLFEMKEIILEYIEANRDHLSWDKKPPRLPIVKQRVED